MGLNDTPVVSHPARSNRFGERRSLLRWLHIGVGGLGLITFLLTGLYMDRSLDHLRGMQDAPRALYRSGHIYILFSALLHVSLGAYVTIKNPIGIRVIQYIGSLSLVASLALFVYGFAVETPQAVVERPMTRAAIELSLAGVLLHAIAVLLPSDTWRSQASSNEHCVRRP